MALFHRDKVIEIAVFGLLGGATGTSIGLLWLAGFKSEHIFALVGALIGAAATVGGAIWVTDRHARLERAREVEILRRDFSKLSDDAHKVRDVAIDGDKSIPEDVAHLLAEYRNKLRASRMIATQAVENSRGLDFRQRAICVALGESMANREEEFDKALDEGRLDHTSVTLIKNGAQTIIEHVRDATTYLAE